MFPRHLYAFHSVFIASFVSFMLEFQPVTSITLFRSVRNWLCFHNSSGCWSGTENLLFLVIKTKFIWFTWGDTFFCGFIWSLESAVEPEIISLNLTVCLIYAYLIFMGLLTEQINCFKNGFEWITDNQIFTGRKYSFNAWYRIRYFLYNARGGILNGFENIRNYIWRNNFIT